MERQEPPKTGLPPSRYHIETWGCQMNVHDSEKLAGRLERVGLRPADGPADADVILLNTCSIREKAAEKVFSELGRLRPLKRRNPRLVIGVCGCVAQEQGKEIFERAPHVDFVIGPRASRSLGELVSRLLRGDESARFTVDLEYRDDSIRFPFDEIRRDGTGKGKAFVTIIEGCNHSCSFCIVPTTRGREISRPMENVLAEVRHLAATGVREVEFLGQTVNAYKDPEGKTLADLLRASARIEGIERIRFTSPHPAQMSEQLMDAMAEAYPRVCPYIHLPVQSGSSTVLRAMRRGHDRSGYLAKIAGLRRRIPGMTFGTDLIVGFPTETREDFAQTLSLLDEVGFSQVYSFAYSPRPAIPALDLGDPIPLGEKLARLEELQRRQKEIQERVNRGWVGRDVSVLVEGSSKRDASEWSGRTPENRVVVFQGLSQTGRFEDLTIVRASAYSLRGELRAVRGR